MKRTRFSALLFTLCLAGCPAPSLDQDCQDDCVREIGPDAGSETGSHTLTIHRQGEGQGTLIVQGEPCKDPCVTTVQNGLVHIKARPANDSNFVSWDQGCQEESTCVIAVKDNLDLAVTFELAGQLEAQKALPGISNAHEVRSDSQGNVYALGSYTVQAPFSDSKSLSKRLTGYLVKYSRQGQRLWNISIAHQDYKMYLDQLAIGPNDEVYVSGTGSKSGQKRLLVYRFDQDSGEVRWRQTAPLTSGHRQAASGELAVGNEGSVFLEGVLRPGEDASWKGTTVSANKYSEGYIASFTASGALLNLLPYGSTNDIHRGGLSVHPDGGLLASMALGDQAWLLHIGEDGQLVSKTQTPTYATALAVAADNTVIAAGNYYEAINWGEDLELPKAPGGKSNIFLAKWQLDGSPLWLKGFGESGMEAVVELGLSTKGNIYLSGKIQGTSTSAPTLGGADLPSYGKADWAIASYTDSGAHRWSHSFGGELSDVSLGLDTRFDGSITAYGSVLGDMRTSIGSILGAEHQNAETPTAVLLRINE